MEVTNLTACFSNFKDTIINIDSQNDIDKLNYVLIQTESDLLSVVSADNKFTIETDIEFEQAKLNGDTMVYINTYLMLKMYENLFKPITYQVFKSFGYFLYTHNLLFTI